MSNENLPHISVCIPTYKRPALLDRCLKALQNQECSGFTYSITVVDNDINGSASETVQGRQSRSAVEIRYDIEPEQNISLTRNRAIGNSNGEFIAFIDDDEFPEPSWLQKLFDACRRFSADGVLGPVMPYFEGTPPVWLVKSGLCLRKSFQTGTRLNNPRYFRAGNLLFSRHIVEGETLWFDPSFGRTGGEDADFLGRMAKLGRTFVWCDEAVVHEEVPEERQTRSYHLRRAMIRGLTSATPGLLLSRGTLKSVVAVIAYTLSLPFLLVAGHHLFMRYLVKDCDHLAKLFAYCGVKLVRERTF
ncbi:glycosyltransferase family 2 protein [Syntrophobacter fumaroxidans]|uniref:Glycosyl transferase, family 2 n=1 Tax=Syntrophobacter fumaroxidans (strain DSM 10017 / MPOB) TaxID=335543 RepID=A0LGV6_SYNFM|nr:glycosyltransferase [Syntrophobacter fumaroxidans]ABK16658.1 glycosyl transferase, family 2 [Syntrophobacter fumaroxidans MPOB]